MPTTSAVQARVDLILIATLLLAIGLRLYRIEIPYVEAHSWRQVTNADIARLWTELPINPLFPQVSWGGPDGYVGMEFPLLHVLTALVWRLFGVSDAAGRLVAVGFSVASVLLIYLLGRRLFSVGVGRGAAFLLAFAPSYVYFGRTLLSDVPMVTFSIATVLAYATYLQTERRRDAVFGAVWFALAGLVKLPAILILGPILWLGWIARRSLARDSYFVVGIIAALGAIGLWYLHADQITQETGLSQAVFRASGRYTGEIAAYSGMFTTVSHWIDWRDPENGMRAKAILTRFYELHLTPFGVLGVALGLVRFRTTHRTVIDVWMLAVVALTVVSLFGQFYHEFHQLPFFPPLALYFGLGMQPLFAWEQWRFAKRRRLIAGVVAAAVFVGLAAAAAVSFLLSPVFLLYRPNHLNTAVIVGGQAIDAATPKDSLLVVVEYDRGGTNSPLLLYYSHRRGWSFDAVAIRPMVIDFLHTRKGACFFATSGWSLIEQLEPETAQYVINTFREIPLPGVDPAYRLFDLGCLPSR